MHVNEPSTHFVKRRGLPRCVWWLAAGCATTNRNMVLCQYKCLNVLLTAALHTLKTKLMSDFRSPLCDTELIIHNSYCYCLSVVLNSEVNFQYFSLRARHFYEDAVLDFCFVLLNTQYCEINLFSYTADFRLNQFDRRVILLQTEFFKNLSQYQRNG